MPQVSKFVFFFLNFKQSFNSKIKIKIQEGIKVKVKHFKFKKVQVP